MKNMVQFFPAREGSFGENFCFITHSLKSKIQGRVLGAVWEEQIGCSLSIKQVLFILQVHSKETWRDKKPCTRTIPAAHRNVYFSVSPMEPFCHI